MVWRLGEFLATGLLIWLAALVAIIVLKLVTGSIPLSGILSPVPNGPLAPTRVQSAGVFLIVIGNYLLEGLTAVSSGGDMPEISETLLVLLTGSSTVYLSGKIVGTRQAASR